MFASLLLSSFVVQPKYITKAEVHQIKNLKKMKFPKELNIPPEVATLSMFANLHQNLVNKVPIKVLLIMRIMGTTGPGSIAPITIGDAVLSRRLR